MKNTHRLLTTLAILVLLIGALTAPSSASPPRRPNCSTCIGATYISFAGSVFDSQTGENVWLDGRLHVTAHFFQNPPAADTRVKAFIVTVNQAVGLTTGNIYDIVVPVDPMTPQDPIRGDLFRINYSIAPPDPQSPNFTPPDPCIIRLHFSLDGGLIGGAATINGSLPE